MKEKIISLLNQENIQELSNVLSTVKKLDLSKCGITDAHAKVLAEVLKFNKSISSVYLNQNILGKEGIEHLVDMLKENHTLIQLNLFNNKYKDASQKGRIKEFLQRNHTEKAVIEALKRKAEEDEKTELQDELTKQLEQAEQEKEALENQLKETQEKAAQGKAKSEEDISALKTEAEKKQADFKSKQDGLQAQVNNLTANNTTLEEAKSELDQQLAKNIEQSTKITAQLTQEKHDTEAKLNTTENHLKALKNAYKELEAKHKEIIEQAAQAKDLFEERLDSLERDANSQIQKQEAKITDLTSKISLVVDQGQKNLTELQEYQKIQNDLSEALKEKEIAFQNLMSTIQGDESNNKFQQNDDLHPLLSEEKANGDYTVKPLGSMCEIL